MGVIAVPNSAMSELLIRLQVDDALRARFEIELLRADERQSSLK